MYSSKEMQNEYGSYFKSMEWDYYLTLTSYYDYNIIQMRAYMKQYYKNIEKIKAGSRMLWVSEPHFKGDYHAHALVKFRSANLNSLNDIGFLKKTWNQTLKKESDSLIVPYDINDEKASGYMFKNINKAGIKIDWDIHGLNNAISKNTTSIEFLPIINQHYI